MTGSAAARAILALAMGATAALAAVGDNSPRAIALGRSYTALARGPEAAFWNPANLALRSSPDFKWEILAAGVGLVAENNAISVKAYNDHFTDDEHILTDRDKQDLLAEVPGEGLRFNMDLMPSVAAGLPANGGTAFPMPWGVHAAVTDDGVQRPHADVSVPRHGHVVDAAASRYFQGHVAALGSSHAIAVVSFQQPGDLTAGEVAGQLHTAMASSRTRCNLITRGALSSSKWQSTASLAMAFRSFQSSPCVKMLYPSALASYPPPGASVTSKMISVGLIRSSSACLDQLHAIPFRHLCEG